MTCAWYSSMRALVPTLRLRAVPGLKCSRASFAEGKEDVKVLAALSGSKYSFVFVMLPMLRISRERRYRIKAWGS